MEGRTSLIFQRDVGACPLASRCKAGALSENSSRQTHFLLNHLKKCQHVEVAVISENE